MENWRNVIGYESLYQVSDKGNMRSLITSKDLKLYKDRLGYIYISLSKDGKSKKYKVHRLVLSAFGRLPKEKEQCNHINGRKFDNRITNLEWLSAGDNQRHAFAIGLKHGKSGSLNPSWIARINQLDLSGKKLRTWESLREIMRETGFDKSAIHRHIKGNKNYSHAYGFRWEFA
jgi:hypothetical protein